MSKLPYRTPSFLGAPKIFHFCSLLCCSLDPRLWSLPSSICLSQRMVILPQKVSHSFHTSSLKTTHPVQRRYHCPYGQSPSKRFAGAPVSHMKPSTIWRSWRVAYTWIKPSLPQEGTSKQQNEVHRRIQWKIKMICKKIMPDPPGERFTPSMLSNILLVNENKHSCFGQAFLFPKHLTTYAKRPSDTLSKVWTSHRKLCHIPRSNSQRQQALAPTRRFNICPSGKSTVHNNSISTSCRVWPSLIDIRWP